MQASISAGRIVIKGQNFNKTLIFIALQDVRRLEGLFLYEKSDRRWRETAFSRNKECGSWNN